MAAQTSGNRCFPLTQQQGPKYHELVRLMKRTGWKHQHTNGSHQQWTYTKENGETRSVTLVKANTRIKPYQVRQVLDAMNLAP